jgi:hypothetical protein
MGKHSPGNHLGRQCVIKTLILPLSLWLGGRALAQRTTELGSSAQRAVDVIGIDAITARNAAWRLTQ